jgi:hypothetical protein
MKFSMPFPFLQRTIAPLWVTAHALPLGRLTGRLVRANVSGVTAHTPRFGGEGCWSKPIRNVRKWVWASSLKGLADPEIAIHSGG